MVAINPGIVICSLSFLLMQFSLVTVVAKYWNCHIFRGTSCLYALL